jgi:NAD-dependent deacetylase
MEQPDVLALTGMYGEEAVEAGIVSDDAVKLVLKVCHPDDLDTEVFKSDCAFTSIPEIDLEIPDGLSRFTTVGTLLREIEENLRNTPAMPGLDKFLSNLGACIGGQPFTLVIEDALGLSTMQPPPHRQSQLVCERTARKASDSIYFGLNRASVLAGEEQAENALSTLVRLVRGASKIVILSGAGISTESGIPAFRSPDGMDNLWDRYDPTKATLGAIQSDESARVEYWSMHSELYELVAGRGVLPNAAHRLAVTLAERGKLLKVITQNIDGLYQAAGLVDSNRSDLLIELHGTVTKARCSHCHVECDRRQVHETWKSGVLVPRCTETKIQQPSSANGSVATATTAENGTVCGAPLRFGTIAFGESLPLGALEAAQKAVRECDLLLIMGTALVVQPANKLPEIALDARTPVVLLNLGPTPLDHVVDLHILDKCGATSQHILNNLDNPAFDPSAPKHGNVAQELPTALIPGAKDIQYAAFQMLLRRK